MLGRLSNRIQQTKARTMTGLFVSKLFWGQLVTYTLDLIFPPQCAGCGRIDTHWCDNCQREVVEQPLPPIQDAPFPLSGIASVGIHKGKLRKAVQALKYDNERSLAQYPLGALLFTRLESLDWTIDTIIPVPLHTNRYRKRGYNQSQLLSEALAEYAMLPVITHALYRNRDTPPQVGLDSHERQRNVSGAFAANPYLVHQKNILLLDDVYTTGATMRACAEALTAAGAHQIYGLTVTVAEPN